MHDGFTWRRGARSPKERSGASVAALSLGTLGIYYAYWIHSLHMETPERTGVDPARRWAVAIPIIVGVVSIVPVLASGVMGDGDVDFGLFAVGMALNFVAHLLYLWVSWKLTDRLAGVAEAGGLDLEGLHQGKRDLALGVVSIAVENVGLKSVSLLGLEVPSWVNRIDALLLGLGLAGLWRWGRECLTVANAYAKNKRRIRSALGIQQTFSHGKEPGALGVPPSQLRRSERNATRLIRRAQWMADGDDSGLGWFLEAEDELMASGVVVAGTIVQANSNLFKDGDSDHPGELVFSLSEDASTDGLLALSSKLYGLKGEETSNEDEAFFSAYLADEMERVVGVAIPDSVSTIPETYVSTTLFYREHLPAGRIASGIYPVLVSPNTRVAMVLPLDLWTEAGYGLYRETGGHEVN